MSNYGFRCYILYERPTRPLELLHLFPFSKQLAYRRQNWALCVRKYNENELYSSREFLYHIFCFFFDSVPRLYFLIFCFIFLTFLLIVFFFLHHFESRQSVEREFVEQRLDKKQNEKWNMKNVEITKKNVNEMQCLSQSSRFNRFDRQMEEIKRKRKWKQVTKKKKRKTSKWI